MNTLKAATYLAIALYFTRKVLQKASRAKPVDMPKRNLTDFSITPEMLKTVVSKLASMDIKAKSRPIAPV
jgi:hypothetical protein